MRFIIIIIIFGVKMLSHVWLFATPWTAACQVSLSFTISRSLLKLMYLSWWCLPTISPSAVPFSSCPQSFPASGSFPMSQLFASGGQRTGASASVLPMNIHWNIPSNESVNIDFLYNQLVWSPRLPRESQESSPAPQFKSTKFLVLRFFDGPALTSVHD